MNNYIPDWNLETDLSMNGQKYPSGSGADHDLVELLWRNGQVVLRSQTPRKQAANVPNSDNQTRPNANGSYGNSMVTDDDNNDETVSWIHYPIEDSFEKEFCSNFFSELPPCDPVNVDKPSAAGNHQMPPPKAVVNSSHCGSNQVVNDPDPDPSWVSSNNTGLSAPVSRRAKKDVARGEKTEVVEPARTSSSDGSGSSFGRGCKQCTTTTTTSGNTNNKRKNREAEELECQSEPAEFESAGTANKSAQRSGTSRKSRAAEVHNLSERRRRDRINEKMKALQELIPHSNKTDKASMLDEAIEYVKSLQLQVQVMWMGIGGMAPMMFPGLQHYMSRMGMGMAMGPPAAAAAMATAMNLPPPRVPVPVVDHPHPAMIVGPTPDQSVLCQAQAFNAMNFQNHPLQNASFPEQYARFMGWNPMQAVSQPMNMFRYNPQTVVQQQGQSMVQQGIISNGPSNGGASIDISGGLGKNIG